MFSIVVAKDILGGIGKDNDIPWKIPGDMKFFKDLTTSDDIAKYLEEQEIEYAPDYVNNIPSKDKRNTVIMVRKTWDSIPEKYRPLPDRNNIVLSRTHSPESSEIRVTSIDGALKLSPSDGYTFVIGGEQVYKEAIEHPDCEYLFVTEVSLSTDSDKSFAVGEDFSFIGHSRIHKSKKGVEYHFTIYRRK